MASDPSGGARGGAPPTPALAVVNGAVYTLDRRRPVAEALFAWQGRVAHTGSRAEVEALAGQAAGCVTLDLRGGCAVPGLTDSHIHFLSYGLNLGRVALTGLDSIKAIEHPLVNVIGHPTARQIGRRPPIEYDLEAVFKAAARTGTALEVNSFPDRLDLRDEHVRWARELGVKLAIDTDSHSPLHLANVRFGVGTAQRGWVEKGDVINTWPLAKLRRFLAKGRR